MSTPNQPENQPQQNWNGQYDYQPAAQYQQQPAAYPPPAPSVPREPGFFRSLFDFRFRHFVTIRFAGVVYAISIVVAVLQWVGLIVSGALAGSAVGSFSDSGGDDYSSSYGSLLSFTADSASSFSPVFLLLAIFLGWIPSAIQIIVTRIVLEFLVAGVRTAQNTTKLTEAGR